ncbi:MAG: T9SS type A sorting domain-containing protein [Bacteroidetes bacterium]|nr:T9SS type A sorting domain-containing protein [Bacteroidota bacterium]
MSANNGQTITTCSGKFEDSGAGTADYASNEDYTITFCSGSSQLLKFDFSAFSNVVIERIKPGDTLFIYDGNSILSPLLYKVTGNAANSDRLPYFKEASDAIFTSPSSCITFRFKSNGSGTNDGWQAQISCVNPTICGSGNSPASDLFLGAPTICNFNNYCGITSGDFGADMPVDLNTAGGSCPSGLNFLGTVENNSWLKFQATSTVASFVVTAPLGGSCQNGVQMAIFSYNGSTLTRLTPCANSDNSWNSTFTLTTNTALVPGNMYYLMIDGNAGDVCNYNISANSGVAIADAGIDKSVCTSSTTLNAAVAIGTGTWTVVSGTGVFSNPNSNVTNVTGLTAGTNIFQWTINTTYCGTISDNITVDAGCLLSVNLTRFDAQCNGNNVLLTWQTASEVNNKKFDIERSVDGVNFQIIGSVKGVGNSTRYNNYSFVDENKIDGLVYYRLTQIDFNEKKHQLSIITSEHRCEESENAEVSIYPNPSLDNAFLSIKLFKRSSIYVEVFNGIGQLVKLIPMQTYEAGHHDINIEAIDLPSGLYFIKGYTNEKESIQKFLKL